MHRTRIISSAVVAACIAFAVLPSAALCIPRDVVIARGMVWANYVRGVDPKTKKKVLGVPYSQAKWAREDGTPVTAKKPDPATVGYRTDCSGFASMCWNLRDSAGKPVSLSTQEFGAKGSKRFFQITKAQLQPGDMILSSAVWGAPSPHAIIFDGWADTAQTHYWALEETTSQSSGITGTVRHVREYGQPCFKPYRYSGLEDAYADVEERVVADPAAVAAAGADASYPATSNIAALVVAGSSQWGDQIAGDALAAAAGGPELLTASTSLPAVTVAQIKRLKPRQIIVVGSPSSVSPAVAARLAALTPSLVRISGASRWDTAAKVAPSVAALDKAHKRALDHAYIVPGAGTAESLAITAVAVREGAPILFTNKPSVPKMAVWSLGRLGVKRVIIVGETNVVAATVDKQLRKAGYRVDRVGGKDGYKTSVAVAGWALRLRLGFSLNRLSVATPAACPEALAAESCLGTTRALLVLSATPQIDPTVRALVAKQRGAIGRARVFGSALTPAARGSLAAALRSGK